MIRNILFDMGNVLIRFDPDRFMNDLDCTEKEKKILMSELFRSTDWVETDRGVIDEEELIRRACERTDPTLHDKIRELANHWHRNHLMIEGSEELVSELYENGYELYLLTNAALRHHIYWPQYPVSRYFPPERVFLSADHKCMKPGPEFFEGAVKLFSLKKEECIFIDDSVLNAEGAVYCGIQAIVFNDDIDELRRKLKAAGVRVK